MSADVKERLERQLRELHLPSFRRSYEELVRQAQQETYSYERFLLELCERECQERRTKRIGRVLQQSRLPLEKSLETFDLKRLPAKLARQVQSLREGSFVDRKENLLAFGKVGSGKTHLLCGLAQEQARAGRRVLFTTSGLLVQELLLAKRDLKLKWALKKLASYEVLLIDDLGYVQQNREEMEVLFTLLAERYERKSVLITSNLVFSQWDQIFKDTMTTAAAVDRVVHHSVILELTIDSYRAQAARERARAER